MHYVRFRPLNLNDETGQNALCGRYLNNRRTGKDATKPRTLGLFGQSDYSRFNQSDTLDSGDDTFSTVISIGYTP